MKSLKDRIDNIRDQDLSLEKAEENNVDKEREEEKEKQEETSNANIEAPIKKTRFDEVSHAGSIRSKSYSIFLFLNFESNSTPTPPLLPS